MVQTSKTKPLTRVELERLARKEPMVSFNGHLIARDLHNLGEFRSARKGSRKSKGKANWAGQPPKSNAWKQYRPSVVAKYKR